MFYLLVILIFACFCPSIKAAEKYPADVSFMVADLKYSTKQGVKICEIQQGCLSLFNGNKFRSPEEESIHDELVRTLSLYNKNGWLVANAMADKNVVSTLAQSSSWHIHKGIFDILSNDEFRHHATQPVEDIYNLASYHGFLYINWSQLGAIYDFEQRFPGMIVIDKSSFPLWIDKYQMTNLFAQDPLLASFKPKWGNYKKIYTNELATQIANDLQCDTFVIKPRGEFLGNGVIITQKDDLDGVLHYIITKQGPLASSKDPAHRSWKKDTFDSFIVEEFVTSDLITIPHLDNKTYQPTMRVAFLLVHNNHQHDVHFLGGYWKTPLLALDEEGNFMAKNKDICKPPYYYAVDPKTMHAVQSELKVALPLLHKKMLECYADAQKKGFLPPKKRNVQIILQEQI